MDTLTNELKSHGFEPFGDDPCLMKYSKEIDGREVEIIAEIFVDDIKWATNDTEVLKGIIAKIGDKYKITVGDTPVTCHDQEPKLG